jgi:biopolymer transport protein ExbD
MAKQRFKPPGPDLTPMIDVVFQLIIFFIVTATIAKEHKPGIEVPNIWHGDKHFEQTTVVIEVDRHGWISINGTPVDKAYLDGAIKGWSEKYGSFPIVIKGDSRTRHDDIRSVMDICTKNRLCRISFVGLHNE